MHRRRRGPLWLATLLAACSAGDSGAPRPDVVLVVIDTLRADHVPWNDPERDLAPFLGELARSGVVFERAHSTSSWTAPATASIFTSLYPLQHGMTTGLRAAKALEQELQRLPDEAETISELFARNGYTTFGVTDNLNISNKLGFERGFDRFRSHNYKGAEVVNAKLLEWKDEIDAAEHAFVYLHYMDPHEPYHVREPWFEGDPEHGHNTHAAYESEISYLDSQLRELFGAFDWAEDALVIVTADHGEEFHEHGAEGHGTALYGETLDVPLFFRWPARWAGGRRISGRASTIDLLPTLVALLDLETHAPHAGRSLERWLDGAPPDARPIYAHLLQEHPQLAAPGQPIELRAWIEGDTKLILSASGAELYDLGADPGELRNLAATRDDEARRLTGALAGLEAALPRLEGARGEVELSEEELEHLRQIGYGE